MKLVVRSGVVSVFIAVGLVTTVYENGETGIGPHALLSPFGITKPHSMLLISRATSGTAGNIRRTGKCALNYIEFDREILQGVSNLGYPGRAPEDKQHDNPFTMVDPPSADKVPNASLPTSASKTVRPPPDVRL